MVWASKAVKTFYVGVASINNIFKGMILVFLNFNLDIGASRIGLIPSFIGYYFMLKGLQEIREFSGRFNRIIPLVTGMIVFSCITYILDLFGVTAAAEVDFFYASASDIMFFMILGLISVLLSLYISYNIIFGIKDIEVNKDQSLNSNHLYSTWKLMAVFSILTFAGLLLIPVLGVIGIIINLVVMVYYLYIFNNTKKLFNEQNPVL